jgi:hypothetical protein
VKFQPANHMPHRYSFRGIDDWLWKTDGIFAHTLRVVSRDRTVLDSSSGHLVMTSDVTPASVPNAFHGGTIAPGKKS